MIVGTQLSRQVLRKSKMGRPSKFQEGQKVKCMLNEYDEYIIKEIRKNTIIVHPEDHPDLQFECKKSLFEVI